MDDGRGQETNSEPSGIRTFQVVLSVNVSPRTARPYAQTSQVEGYNCKVLVANCDASNYPNLPEESKSKRRLP